MRKVNYMKLVSQLATVLVTCLVVVAPLALPAEAQDGAAYISLSPSAGVPGDIVTVTGGNFTAGEWVDIYYAGMGRTQASVTAGGTFTATFDVPDSYRGQHTVLARDDTGKSASRDFTVRSGLTVSPEEGQVGDTVTVTGRGYGRNETGIELYFGGQRMAEDRTIAANVDGWWQEEFEVPPSIRGSHTIETRPAAHRDAVFTVVAGISIAEPWGSPGDSIIMTGGGFTTGERNIRILFAGEEVREDIWADDRGYWQETFEVPERPRGHYVVTAEGDRTTKEDAGDISFEIRPGIVLSPDEGHVGMNVTAIGRGFAANKGVIIMYEDDEVATNTTDNKGSFEVMFAVPESRHGERQVTAEDDAGNKTEKAAIFTMESDPPETPELISPIDGARVGFVFKVRPRFEWSEVEDLSDVYYSLQISASANITPEGDFFDPIRSKEGLVGANYTLERAEALPHGTYYWIVRAVDGAENESGWTEAQSFQAGRLPLWAFIVIIVFVVLLAGTLVYFHVVRRRLYD
jgi:hypothetical protein